MNSRTETVHELSPHGTCKSRGLNFGELNRAVARATKTRTCVLVILIIVAVLGCASPQHRGMVASVQPIATDAGVNALKSGGNAIDAAVATAITLGVVDGHNSGIGGGCFMLVRVADGRCFAIDGREVAPALATRDMFIRNGVANPTLSQTGALAAGVPGSLAVYDYALKHFGHKTLRDLLLPAAGIADQGFPINATYATKLANAKSDIAKFPGTRAILLKQNGEPYAKGEILIQHDLAKTYRGIAAEGIDYFYRGTFAQTVDQWMKSNGGIVRYEDFAAYQLKLREPLRTTYRGYEIIGFPPPSSGGVHVAEILNILDNFDLAKLDETHRIHVTAEAMSLAFADRAFWLGDPDFVLVPRGLIDPKYAADLAKQISLNRAGDFDHGTPPNAEQDLFSSRIEKHTTHIAVADDAGNFVALTCTINTPFGSKVIVPGTGVLLNNQMDDFSIQPGVPNHFKLIGAEANAVAPKKRPLSSMSPTIVLKDGQPVMTIGAAGGPKIITQVVLGISNTIDLRDDPKMALSRPRYHDQWRPNVLMVEKTFPPDLIAKLKAMGHQIEFEDSAGATQMIEVKDGKLIGQQEPRSEGKAAGN